MPPRFDLHLPKRGGWPWIAIIASVLAHSLLLFGWITGRIPDVPVLPRQLIVLSPSTGSPDEANMRYQLEEPLGAGGPSTVPERRRGPPARQVPEPDPAASEEPVTVLPPPERLDQPETESRTPEAAPTGAARIGPGLAAGRLWVRPLPLPPRELAQRLSQSNAELLDSTVSVIVQAYLDSIAGDPATKDVGLPSWTTEVAGRKFGLDSQNIYIAGLKIPAAVLALLPVSGGNIDQNRAYNRLMDLRADLLYAGRRAETLEEFKQVIREMRLRKEREREMQRNQRTAPPPEIPATP